MKTAGLQPVVIDTFAWYYEKVLSGDKGMIFNKDIRPVDPHEIADELLAKLPRPEDSEDFQTDENEG